MANHELDPTNWKGEYRGRNLTYEPGSQVIKWEQPDITRWTVEKANLLPELD